MNTPIRERIKRARGIEPDCPWHHRGYLPHFDSANSVQFITLRLAGSIPRNSLRKLKHQHLQKQITEIEYHRAVERILDAGYGPTFLGRSEIAALVSENLLHFDGSKYQLLRWVIMPTHVHILLEQLGQSLASIIHSLKSYTANRANKLLDRSGSFWSADYYDRYVRDGKHFLNTVNYIHRNPVKANMCGSSAEWDFGCAKYHG
ncbi:MAG: transposase [Acidobacteria bacterium]|nr:transposase [Acidobacteriota bacterium]